jgi:hypothetical protein
MTKNRTKGPDVMPPKPKKPSDKPGTLDEHHIPIYDHKDRMRGHVGPLATEVTVARFTGQHGSKLGKRDGKPAWISPPPPPKPKPKFLQPGAPGASGVPGAAPGAALSQSSGGPKQTLEISLKQAKGSVTKNPTAPKTTARPKRGG